MEAKEFQEWLKLMGFSERKAAQELGLSRATVSKYRDEGAPLYIGYACAAMIEGLEPWPPNATEEEILERFSKLDADQRHTVLKLVRALVDEN